MAEVAPGAFVLVMNALRPERGGRRGAARHDLSGRNVLALLVVADRCGAASGTCTASLPTLAATAGMSRATMQRALASLVRAGWLSRKARHRDLTDVLSLGPMIRKRSHAETSQPAMSQPERATSQPATAETSQAETQSTPFKHSNGKRSNGPSDADASGSAPAPSSRSTDGNDNGAGTVHVVTAEVVNWSQAACEDWMSTMGGTAPGGRIGKALAPLVKAKGWDVVRPAWERYLAEKNSEYATAEDFASHFGLWGNPRAFVDPRDRAMLAAIEGGLKPEPGEGS